MAHADPNNDEYSQSNKETISKTDSMNVNSDSLFETNCKDTIESFEDMGLKEELLRGIFGYGFDKPSPIQQRGIIPVIKS